jgi:hypothetical protein
MLEADQYTVHGYGGDQEQHRAVWIGLKPWRYLRGAGMKQRLIVMNGYRILECEHNGQWRTDKVDKANGLRPYIYSLDLAISADQTRLYDGVVLYANKEFVYQHVKMNLFDTTEKHSRRCQHTACV